MMGNKASLEVYASPQDVIEALSAGRTTSVNEMGATEIAVPPNGALVVGSDIEDGNVLVVVDYYDDTNGYARIVFDELCAQRPWRISLLDADTCEIVAERSAVKAVS